MQLRSMINRHDGKSALHRQLCSTITIYVPKMDGKNNYANSTSIRHIDRWQKLDVVVEMISKMRHKNKTKNEHRVFENQKFVYASDYSIDSNGFEANHGLFVFL